MNIRSVVYKGSVLVMRQVWRLVGGRRLQVFGQSIKVTSDTVFPIYRKFPLPKKEYGAEIVRYCDYVQMHALVHCLSKMTSPSTIVEVGAHHGAYTVLLGRIAKNVRGRIIAIEPNPEAFKVLLRNIAMNGLEETVVCVQTAVMNSHGVLNLSLKGGESHITLINTTGTYPVQVTKLSDLFNAYGVKHIHLLKIDVEGAELRVLEGFPWDSVGLDHIYCELHPYAWKHFGYSREDVHEFLKRHNYRCLDMYFEEHMLFNSDAYIGPCLLLSQKA